MTENKSSMQQYAMIFGTYMGLFWILKFILVPTGLTSPFLLMLFICLTLCVPFMGYYYTRLYRDRVCDGSITFFHALMFNIFMYACASLLTSAAHYVYFGFIDRGHILDICRGMLAELRQESLPGMEDYLRQVKESLDMIGSLTPADIVLKMLGSNIYYCTLLSIPTALFAMRRKKETPYTTP